MITPPKPAIKRTRIRPNQSVDGAVMRRFTEVQGGFAAPAPTALVSKNTAGKSQALQKSSRAHQETSLSALFDALEPDSAKDLAKRARALREGLVKQNLVSVETVRTRAKGLDRQLQMEFYPDPESPTTAMLVRMTMLSDKPLAATRQELLTTQQAADLLNVSRPYVARMVDDGKLGVVERTRANHRRILLVEVERVREEMRRSRRKALDELDAESQELRNRELSAAKADPKNRWLRKA